MFSYARSRSFRSSVSTLALKKAIGYPVLIRLTARAFKFVQRGNLAGLSCRRHASPRTSKCQRWLSHLRYIIRLFVSRRRWLNGNVLLSDGLMLGFSLCQSLDNQVILGLNGDILTLVSLDGLSIIWLCIGQGLGYPCLVTCKVREFTILGLDMLNHRLPALLLGRCRCRCVGLLKPLGKG